MTIDELETLSSKLAGEHDNCEDPWYSCPLSSEGCCNSNAGTECTCGVTQRRKAILEVLRTAYNQGRGNRDNS